METTSSVINPEAVLPSPDFHWIAPDPGFYILYYKGKDTKFMIQSLHTGSYLVIIGGRDIIEVSTLRHAQGICHALAWIFKDSLPAPERLKERG